MLVKWATGVESGIFRENLVNIMAVEDRALCVPLISAAMVECWINGPLNFVGKDFNCLHYL